MLKPYISIIFILFSLDQLSYIFISMTELVKETQNEKYPNHSIYLCKVKILSPPM